MKKLFFLLMMALSLNAMSQTAKCRNAIVVLSSLGNGSVTTNGINNGSTGYATLSLNQSTFNCSSVGTNVITLTATASSGNTSTCTSIVTVKDSTKPSAKCKDATVVIQSDSTLSYQVVDDGSFDKCGISEYVLSPNQFPCVNGTTSVTLTVKDVNGNISQCSGIVTIICSN